MTTDTDPAELVTEEMVRAARTAYDNDGNGWAPSEPDGMRAALRAVAPMIAAEALTKPVLDAYCGRAVAAEREACARQAARLTALCHTKDEKILGNAIAAAIRARGETA